MKPVLNNLLWIEELLSTDVIQENMHNGVGYYLDDKLMIIIVESSFTYDHKGVTYPFKIWNGCLFPIVRIKQNAVFAKFPFLENHPASPNWLYLAADSENFDEEIKALVREINKRNPLFGIPIQIKIRSKKKATESEESLINTSRPSLFSEPAKTTKSAKPVKKVKANKKQTNNLLMSVLKRRTTV